VVFYTDISVKIAIFIGEYSLETYKLRQTLTQLLIHLLFILITLFSQASFKSVQIHLSLRVRMYMKHVLQRFFI